ncbi:helix-turn-helix domain-containing protein [Aliarcobacter skirrowii]|uniref:helix-turn-helix domain-containing protein n=1 Tax=Aliarcobacter skirrowii TaxID=28200 RepID=UPI002A370139|nr:helix-turn-helix domain-containing protein [Aliarcobacter skirrowii]MDY0179810.1 helix-turn-helix domain-containing protein [Aliarcobacter skirrowii]
MNEKLLTKEELAVRLNISAYDVDKLRKDRKMPFTKIGRAYRYDLEKVLNFIKTLSSTNEGKEK